MHAAYAFRLSKALPIEISLYPRGKTFSVSSYQHFSNLILPWFTFGGAIGWTLLTRSEIIPCTVLHTGNPRLVPFASYTTLDCSRPLGKALAVHRSTWICWHCLIHWSVAAVFLIRSSHKLSSRTIGVYGFSNITRLHGTFASVTEDWVLQGSFSLAFAESGLLVQIATTQHLASA